MRVIYLQNSCEYHDFEEDHILVSCYNYYNNRNYCRLHFMIEASPENNPTTVSSESCKLLIDILNKNKENENLPVVFVGNDARISREIYYFVANVFGNKDYPVKNDMAAYLVINKVWQKIFNIKLKKQWKQSNPKRLLDVLQS